MERERSIITGLILLLMVLSATFLVHQSPRFAGSAWGGAFGVAATLCMLVPLAYTLVKRLSWLKSAFPNQQARLLNLHIYISMAGAFFAIVHSGHKFQSWLGIALMTLMLLSILSGYLGRHFLRYVSLELAEQEHLLLRLRAEYNNLAQQLASNGNNSSANSLVARLRAGLASVIAGWSYASEPDPVRRAIGLVGAIADVEYSIKANETIKRKLRIWLVVHIATSIAFYVLLILHILAGIQFGLRWFA